MASQSRANSPRSVRSWLALPLQVVTGLILLALLLPFVLVQLVCYVAIGVVLHVFIWVWWCSRGRHVLLVYSNSPIWRKYIDREVLPLLPESTIKLNWSQRRQWQRFSLAVLAFDFLAGRKEFNPMIIVFRPLRPNKTFRLYKAFVDYKHGNSRPLDEICGKLAETLQPAGIADR